MSDTPRSALAVVEVFLDAFETMDMEKGLALVADDCEYTNVPIGTVHGHSGLIEVLGPFSEPIERNEFIIRRKAEAGPIVFVERLDRRLLKTGECASSRSPVSSRCRKAALRCGAITSTGQQVSRSTPMPDDALSTDSVATTIWSHAEVPWTRPQPSTQLKGTSP